MMRHCLLRSADKFSLVGGWLECPWSHLVFICKCKMKLAPVTQQKNLVKEGFALNASNSDISP